MRKLLLAIAFLSLPCHAQSLSPSGLSFGTVVSSSTMNMTLSGGATTVTLNNIHTTSSNGTDFSQTNNCVNPFTSTSTCVISVTFTPSAPNGTNETGTVFVGWSSGGSITVNLTGTSGNSSGGPTATIDWTNPHQVIDGFGANLSNMGGTASVLHFTSAQAALFFGQGSGQLGLSLIIAPGTNNFDNWGTGNCTTVNTGCAGAYTADLGLANSYGAKAWIMPFSPPATYTTNGSTICQNGGGNGTLAAAHFGDYATWLANQVKSVQAIIPVAAISVQNEPEFCEAYSSIILSAQQIHDFVTNNLGPTFVTQGISSTLIFLPQTGSFGNMQSYGNTCATDLATNGCASFMGGAMFDDYDASVSLAQPTVNSTTYPATWAAGKKFWEGGTSCAPGGGPGWCLSGFQTSMNNALYWAADIDHRLAVDNMNSWNWWWFMVPSTAGNDEGLITSDTNVVPLRAYATGQYARFIRPGYVRIDATHNPVSGVSVSAYQNTPTNNLVIVATNYTSSPVTQTFNLVHAPTFNTVTPYITSATLSMAQQANQGVSSNTFNYTLPMQSVTTFVGTGTGGGGGNTIIPTDCSQASWAGLQSQLNPLSGSVTVAFPACSNSWTGTTTTTLSVPSAITNLLIQGQTSVTCINTPGASNYSCTATDTSTITNNMGANNEMLQITLAGANSLFRMAGFSILDGSGPTSTNAEIVAQGNSHNFRFDHNHFNNSTSQNVILLAFGDVQGVADHNYFTTSAGSFGEQVEAFNPGTGDSFGDASWASSTTWGTSAALFFESNYITGGTWTNCYNGGRIVVRYNTGGNSSTGSAEVVLHQTGGGAGRPRGCRTAEIYHNYFSSSAVAPQSAVPMGGAELIWANASNGFQFAMASNIIRSDPSSSHGGAPPPPTNWGGCGTSTLPGTAWDGKQNTTTGYPCLDQPGRGQTPQALNGQAFPNALNSVTGTIAWPQQYLEPVYMWGNSVSGAGAQNIGWNNLGGDIASNRDVYWDCVSGNTACSSGFTGAAGTGMGLLSARPNTCTPGAGGTYGQSPTGSYGVAYFATDANGGQGELYVCTAASTWTPVYEPYQYPHPLTTPVVSIAPTTMNFGSVVVGASSSPQTATLTNGTASSITLSPVTITGANPSAFTIGANSCNSGSVAANGGTCSVTMQFAPTSTGAQSATLNVNTSAGTYSVSMSGTGTSAVNPGISISPASIAFGNISVGVPTSGTTVTITSTTSANLVMGTPPATITGTNAGDFSLAAIGGQCTNGQSIPQNSTCVESVVFTPSATGARSAQLNIFNNVAGSPQTVSLSGTGVGTIALNPTSMNFGLIAQGQTSAAQTLTFTNNTGITLSLSGTSFTNPDFAATANTCGVGTLGNGVSCTMSITFRPSATTGTNETGFVNIGFTGVGGSPAQVPLAGSVLPPIGTPATNIFAANLAACGAIPKLTTFCFTATGKIYVAVCNPVCTGFAPLTMSVWGISQ